MKSEKKKATSLETTATPGGGARRAGREVWLAGLGVLATLEEGARETFERWVKLGRRVESRGGERLETQLSELRSNLRERAGRVDRRLRGSAGATLERFGVPTSGEVQDLIRRIERLTEQVESLGAAEA